MRKEIFLLAGGAVFFFGCAEMSMESVTKAVNEPPASPESAFIDALDHQYQALFADLELTKEKMVEVKRTDGKTVMVKRTARVGGSRMTAAPPSHANLQRPFED